ncbi:ABC transporter [Nocardioides lijunqiniae]|uniref:ABC transporter n=1 Tax=Nocardioides lijunqiniae TaxID=2760832 RepID=UPI0018784759|nr:ABC transporter [Nocardioides lijunqiniae]
MSPRAPALALMGLIVPIGLACSAPGQDTAARRDEPATEEDHGKVAGAAELSEPAYGLTTVDPSGVVRHLDLVEGAETGIADLGPATKVQTDGRFLFVDVAGGVDVVDSGVWTWDHVDHFHYYRAEPREVGRLTGAGPSNVATTTSSTSGGTGVFFPETGEAVLLDTAALADGGLSERYRLEVPPHEGLLVPVGEHALLTEPGPDGTPDRVVALDPEGERLPGAAHRCERASGTITTRVGAVVGCADGALLATSDGDRLKVERIPYPAGRLAPRATSFAGRDGRPTVAALAGRDRIWLLDTRQRAWRLLDAPVALRQVTAVDDDDEHVLGLTVDGRVAVIDGVTGDLLSTTPPLAAASLGSGVGEPVLVVDQQRAYLSAPAERRLHEIDFRDGARVARTFPTPTTPLFTAGTGR